MSSIERKVLKLIKTFSYMVVVVDNHVLDNALSWVCTHTGNNGNCMLRRYGSRNSFKAYKLLNIIRKRNRDLFIMLLMETGCMDDMQCLARVVTRYLTIRLKSSFRNVYTLGDLCRELYGDGRRRGI